MLSAKVLMGACCNSCSALCLKDSSWMVLGVFNQVFDGVCCSTNDALFSSSGLWSGKLDRIGSD